MKIAVTGATGFLGAHTAMALLDAGHELRLLVRNPEAASRYFLSLGYAVADIVKVDMLDAPAVKKALQGCEALVHAAAIVDLEASNAHATIKTNVSSIDNVVEAACLLGLQRIIYISSMTVMFTPNGGLINEQSPLSNMHDAYSYSKKLCEEKVRQLQQQGYSIIITYPSSVLGPNDPKMSQSNNALLQFLTLALPISSSGIQYVDVRDVAKAHVLLLQKPLAVDKTQERYFVAGHFSSWSDFATLLNQSCHIQVRKVRMPGFMLRAVGWLLDAVRQVRPISIPITVESAKLVSQSPQYDSSYLLRTIDMQFRPPQETLADTAAWLRAKHYLQ